MDLNTLTKIVQVFLAVILILLLIIQGKGGGLSQTFGAGFSTYRSKRGVEKLLFFTTIVFGILLVANSFVLLRM